MFALSGLLDGAVPLLSMPGADGGVDLRQIASKEYRFPVPSMPAMRLPRTVTDLADLLVAAGPAAPLCWAALANPVYCVPLVAPPTQRRAALLAAGTEGDKVAVAVATLGVRSPARRNSPTEIIEQDVDVARDREDILDLLERVWIDADHAARAVAAGAPALWLGGDPVVTLPGGDVRVAGVCATFGLRAEIARDASRHTRQIAARMGARPPSYLVVWQPAARGLDAAVRAFRGASVEGELIELCEPALADALLELRWKLDGLGLADGFPPGESPSMKLPVVGEERFYIKHRGSKVGDVMIEVDDCGHGQWGSDVRRLAPRAYKGITAGVKVKPQALFRCARCSKHRWRARY